MLLYYSTKGSPHQSNQQPLPTVGVHIVPSSRAPLARSAYESELCSTGSPDSPGLEDSNTGMGPVGSLASAAFLFHERYDVSPSGLTARKSAKESTAKV